MKKLTNYQRTAQYLNKVFKLINEEYFNNELEVPTITIQSTVGAYGHVSVKKVHLPLLRKLFQSYKNIKGTLYGLQCSV